MPGAPPVKLVSVAVIRATPFWEKVSFEPATLRFNWVPAARARLERGAAELGPGATDPLVEHQLRVAVVPEVETEIEALAAVLGSHCRADPLSTAELGGGDLDLGGLVAGVGLAGADVARVGALGAHDHLGRDRHPTVGHIGPAGPEGSVGPVEVVRDGAGGVWFTQATETLVTSAVPTVPEGFVTVQVCPVGLVLTVTL